MRGIWERMGKMCEGEGRQENRALFIVDKA
jgi:hypothetical protein